jgi:hypothetical protein
VIASADAVTCSTDRRPARLGGSSGSGRSSRPARHPLMRAPAPARSTRSSAKRPAFLTGKQEERSRSTRCCRAAETIRSRASARAVRGRPCARRVPPSAAERLVGNDPRPGLRLRPAGADVPQDTLASRPVDTDRVRTK